MLYIYMLNMNNKSHINLCLKPSVKGEARNLLILLSHSGCMAPDNFLMPWQELFALGNK